MPAVSEVVTQSVMRFLIGLLMPVLVAGACKDIRVLTYNIHHGEGIDGKFDLTRYCGVARGGLTDEANWGRGYAGGAGGVDKASGFAAQRTCELGVDGAGAAVNFTSGGSADGVKVSDARDGYALGS